jgi:hypothetical protein
MAILRYEVAKLMDREILLYTHYSGQKKFAVKLGRPWSGAATDMADLDKIF